MRKFVEINIDEIVLHGLEERDTEGIKKAIETELIRLFKEQGVPSSFSYAKKLRHIDAGRFSLPLSSSPDYVGNEIAGSVYHGIKNQTSLSRK